MAKGVKRRWNMPRGPFLEKIKKRINPSTTVGIPRKALKEPLTKRLPGKSLRPRTIDIGKLHSIDIAIANTETYNERSVMLKTVASKEKMSWNALIMPSMINFLNQSRKIVVEGIPMKSVLRKSKLFDL